MTGHCWDVKYRLISMVTMPVYGCVGSGPIANEKRGSGVLLGRLVYTNTVGRLFPTVLKTNNVSCINYRSTMWSLCLICSKVMIKCLVDNILGMPITNMLKWQWDSSCASHGCWFHSWLFSPYSALFCPFYGFLACATPTSVSDISQGWSHGCFVRNESYDKQLVTSASDALNCLRATNPHGWVSVWPWAPNLVFRWYELLMLLSEAFSNVATTSIVLQPHPAIIWFWYLSTISLLVIFLMPFIRLASITETQSVQYTEDRLSGMWMNFAPCCANPRSGSSATRWIFQHPLCFQRTVLHTTNISLTVNLVMGEGIVIT